MLFLFTSAHLKMWILENNLLTFITCVLGDGKAYTGIQSWARIHTKWSQNHRIAQLKGLLQDCQVQPQPNHSTIPLTTLHARPHQLGDPRWLHHQAWKGKLVLRPGTVLPGENISLWPRGQAKYQMSSTHHILRMLSRYPDPTPVGLRRLY